MQQKKNITSLTTSAANSCATHTISTLKRRIAMLALLIVTFAAGVKGQLVDGGVYHILNKARGSALSINNNVAYPTPAAYVDNTNPNQLWKLTANEGKYALMNMGTNKYLNYSSYFYTQWPMSDAPVYFYVDKQNNDYYYISYEKIEKTSTEYSTCAHDDNLGRIVRWDNTADASQWTFNQAKVSNPEISMIAGKISIACSTLGATIYYTTNGTEPSTTNGTVYTSSFAVSSGLTIRAIAVKDGYENSDAALYNVPVLTIISTQKDLQNMKDGYYILQNDIELSGFTSISEFTGTFDGAYHTISGLTSPLFTSANGATIKNVVLKSVSISNGDSNGDAGAIACSATGATRIYNCGILSGSVSGTRYTGSLLGKLDGNARVINCYSFANVSGGTSAAGIVGYNSTATTQNNITSSGMVMNCMFYGEINDALNIAPVFGGENISNNNTEGTALNTFNFFRYMSDYCQNGKITNYNCALGAKELHLKRFEFYRYLLNSNRNLAAWYATGSTDNAHSIMAKWVLDKTIAPYPILKEQGIYPSIINYDAANATIKQERNKGGKLGTLNITINSTRTNAPTGAIITKTSLTLNRTDKDYDNYNFNYDKVQLPYYNEVGTGNYTYNKVVTGWKVTISGGTNKYNTESYDVTTDSEGNVTDTPFNFANRNCVGKDNYETSGRIFPQGGYLNVPKGVESITIEPYWGKAVYLSDPCLDRVYDESYSGSDVTIMGTQYTNGTEYNINGDEQVVYTTMGNALNQLSGSGSVYDQAIVLVGNYHLYAGNNENPFGNSKPCTIMSADLNMDNEPDYSLMLHHHERKVCPPIRFDFLNLIPFGIAQKVFSDKAPQMPNIAIFMIKGWFEITTTCITELTEFEYDYNNKTLAPLILLGGHIGQIVSQNTDNNYNPQKTTYIHIGDNVYFDNFCNGIHSDKSNWTRHCPISVTGGEYDNFYLSGLYKPGVTATEDDAECYVDGGKFGEVAGAAHESINGDVYWFIENAEIENFFGGGINAANPITGNINVTINNSDIGLYCGGPKFGDMKSGMTVKTTATGSTFGTFFGAGYGGTALNRVISENESNTTDYPKDWVNNYKRSYNNTYKAISTSYETEYFAWAGGTATSNVARFYINFASLSLAKTNNVTSILSNCTINTNFYGGGNLGAVNGNVVSQLTDCTVKANAYGAGFSATIPQVEVYPTTGFVTPPTYNSNVGVYNDPVYPQAVEYTWSKLGSTDKPFTEDEDGNWIYTDVTLSEMGRVSGDTKITISGNTTIEGSVYGGGNETDLVDGTATVNIEGGTINENVFGGGNQGQISSAQQDKGNTQVNITGGTIRGNVYGGGNRGNVSGKTNVTVGQQQTTP